MTGGQQEGAGEPAQFETGQLLAAEPGHIAELVVVGDAGKAIDDLRLVDGRDVGGQVSIGLGDLVFGAAEHVKQPGEPNFGAYLLPGLADRGLGRGLPHLDRTPEDRPSVVVTGVTDQEEPSRFIRRKDRDRRQQQLMTDGRPQPGDVCRHTHRATVRREAGQQLAQQDRLARADPAGEPARRPT